MLLKYLKTATTIRKGREPLLWEVFNSIKEEESEREGKILVNHGQGGQGWWKDLGWEARDFENWKASGERVIVIRFRGSWSAWQRACIGHWRDVCQACRAKTWLCDLSKLWRCLEYPVHILCNWSSGSWRVMAICSIFLPHNLWSSIPSYSLLGSYLIYPQRITYPILRSGLSGLRI